MKKNQNFSIMVVPHLGGSTYSFQVKRNVLIGIVIAGLLSMVLVAVGIASFIISGLSGHAQQAEQARYESTYKVKYLRLETLYKQYVENSDLKIKELEDLLMKISSFAGIPIEKDSEKANVADEEKNYEGKGGPLKSIDPLTPLELDQLVEDSSMSRLWFESRMRYIQYLIDCASSVQTSLEMRESLLERTPLLLPVDTRDYNYTDGYGYRIHPLYKKRDFHEGQDIAAAYMTPVIAPADGKATYAAKKYAYGNLVEIDHSYGLSFSSENDTSKVRYKTRFAHLAKINVKKGDSVARGDIIGYVGSTGSSTGNHLHYEVWMNGKTVDPRLFILND